MIWKQRTHDSDSLTMTSHSGLVCSSFYMSAGLFTVMVAMEDYNSCAMPHVGDQSDGI